MSISINTIILSLLFFPICTLPSTQLIRACAREPRFFYITVLFFGFPEWTMNSVSTIAAILSRASRSFERISSDVLASAYIVAMASFCDISSLGVLGSNSVSFA